MTDTAQIYMLPPAGNPTRDGGSKPLSAILIDLAQRQTGDARSLYEALANHARDLEDQILSGDLAAIEDMDRRDDEIAKHEHRIIELEDQIEVFDSQARDLQALITNMRVQIADLESRALPPAPSFD